MFQREVIRQLGIEAELNTMVGCSPKAGGEAFDTALDINRRVEGCDAGPVKRLHLIGATLRPGCYGRIHKTTTLRWVLFLVIGPPLNYFRSKQQQVRCVTTDCGVERLVAIAHECVGACSQWVRRELGPGPRFGRVLHLFESIVWVPHWNHLWSNAPHTHTHTRC